MGLTKATNRRKLGGWAMRWLLASMSTRCNCTSHTVTVNDIRSDLCSGSFVIYTDGCLSVVDDVAIAIWFYFSWSASLAPLLDFAARMRYARFTSSFSLGVCPNVVVVHSGYKIALSVDRQVSWGLPQGRQRALMNNSRSLSTGTTSYKLEAESSYSRGPSG